MVGHTPPAAVGSLAPGDPVPLRLGDPPGMLRDRLNLDPPSSAAATVVLVDQDRQIVLIQDGVTSLARFQAELTDLARN
jgi:hypothetical protein